MFISRLIVALLLQAFFTSSITFAAAGLNGIWELQEKTINGEPFTAQKRLVISTQGYSAISILPVSDQCALIGSKNIIGNTIRVQIVSGDCDSPESPGSTMEYQYELSADMNNLVLSYVIHNDSIKENYHRQRSDSNDKACAHLFCGIWNRVATYLSGQLMHNKPAYTVITDNEYYSTTDVCFNTVSIDTIDQGLVSGVMQAHNCPLGPYDPQPPGTKVYAVWGLSDGNNTLTIDDSRFGPMVTTEFKRIN